MESVAQIINRINVFMLDMDGTVYLGDKLIDGATQAIDAIRKSGRRICFLTNNSSVGHKDYIAKLSKFGIAITTDEIWTSGQSTIKYLQDNFKNKKIFLTGTEKLINEFKDADIILCGEESAEVAVIGFDMTLTYQKLTSFCNLVRKGLPYIATHPDLNCPISNGGYIPDLGSMIKLIEASAGRLPDVICGKPYKPMFQSIAAKFNVQPSRLAMVGDRLTTDIKFAVDNGFTGILVLSGETDRNLLEKSVIKPTIVFDGLKDIIMYL